MKFPVLLLALAVPLLSQNTPTAQEIVARMTAMNAARNRALQSYSSTRTYQVSYKGFPGDRGAKMVVRLDYSAPDTKRFTVVSEEGSKLLLNRVIRKALESEQEAATEQFRAKSAVTEENYEFKLLGTEPCEGRSCYVLQVKPHHAEKYLYDGRIWIDTADYAIVKVEAKPAKNPSFWISSANIQHRNQKIKDFWLPAENRSTSHVRLGGNAQLTIEYGEYQISGTPVNAGDAVRSTR
jgi:outer membrane lipoprotein-sorting protein